MKEFNSTYDFVSRVYPEHEWDRKLFFTGQTRQKCISSFNLHFPPFHYYIYCLTIRFCIILLWYISYGKSGTFIVPHK